MNSTVASITIKLSRPDLAVLADALGALAARKDTTMPWRTFANGLAARLQVFDDMEAWRELNAQTEIAARSIQAEAKRRGIKLPPQFTRAFSFE